MNLIALKDARAELWAKGIADGATSVYEGSTEAERAAWDRRLNQVTERFLEMLSPARTYRRIAVPIYDNQLTLPRQAQGLLGIRILDSDEQPGNPLYIYSRFHEFAESGHSAICAPIAQPLTETAQTFRDPEAGFKLRAKSTASNGQSYTLSGGTDTDDDEYFDDVTLEITNGTTTTTREWNTLPWLTKDVTDKGVSLYAVDDDDAETLLAVHGPGETSPAYQRYSTPSVTDGTVARILTRLCHVPVRDDNEIVYPSSYGALKLGLQALRYEDVNDWDNAKAAWREAVSLVDSGKQQLEGEAELMTYRAVPGFGCGGIAHVQ